ncbi:MAG: AAC(3) family N-acetyltransferase [Armatimonadota bacterium]
MNTKEWKAQFISALKHAGVDAGRSILVHSSFKAMNCPGTPDDVIDALLETVGPSGTLAVPTHTWDIVNAKQPVFDVLLSPSHVGAITNFVRRRPDAVRSLHPTHSVAAIGPRAVELTSAHECHDTPCSRTSPYGRIVDWDGLIIMLGVSLLYNTTFHGVEEWTGMPWLFAPGVKEDLYSIDIEGHRIHVPSFRHGGHDRAFEEKQADLEHEGILKSIPWGGKSILVVKAKPMAEYVGQRLMDDSNYLLASPA